MSTESAFLLVPHLVFDIWHYHRPQVHTRPYQASDQLFTILLFCHCSMFFKWTGNSSLSRNSEDVLTGRLVHGLCIIKHLTKVGSWWCFFWLYLLETAVLKEGIFMGSHKMLWKAIHPSSSTYPILALESIPGWDRVYTLQRLPVYCKHIETDNHS